MQMVFSRKNNFFLKFFSPVRRTGQRQLRERSRYQDFFSSGALDPFISNRKKPIPITAEDISAIEYRIGVSEATEGSTPKEFSSTSITLSRVPRPPGVTGAT